MPENKRASLELQSCYPLSVGHINHGRTTTLLVSKQIEIRTVSADFKQKLNSSCQLQRKSAGYYKKKIAYFNERPPIGTSQGAKTATKNPMN